MPLGEFVVAEACAETGQLRATWPDGMTWAIPGTSSGQAASVGEMPKLACQLFKEKTKDGCAVVAKVVNHKNKGNWYVIFKDKTQVLQLSGFKPEYWDEAGDWIANLARKYAHGNVTKEEMEAQKQKWLLGKAKEHATKEHATKEHAPKGHAPKSKPKAKAKGKGKAAASVKGKPAAGAAGTGSGAGGNCENDDDDPSKEGDSLGKATDAATPVKKKRKKERGEKADDESSSVLEVPQGEELGGEEDDADEEEEEEDDDDDRETETAALKRRPASSRPAASTMRAIKGKPAASELSAAPPSEPATTASAAPSAASMPHQEHPQEQPMQTGAGPNGSPRFRPPPMPDWICSFGPFGPHFS